MSNFQNITQYQIDPNSQETQQVLTRLGFQLNDIVFSKNDYQKENIPYIFMSFKEEFIKAKQDIESKQREINILKFIQARDKYRKQIVQQEQPVKTNYQSKMILRKKSNHFLQFHYHKNQMEKRLKQIEYKNKQNVINERLSKLHKLKQQRSLTKNKSSHSDYECRKRKILQLKFIEQQKQQEILSKINKKVEQAFSIKEQLNQIKRQKMSYQLKRHQVAREQSNIKNDKVQKQKFRKLLAKSQAKQQKCAKILKQRQQNIKSRAAANNKESQLKFLLIERNKQQMQCQLVKKINEIRLKDQKLKEIQKRKIVQKMQLTQTLKNINLKDCQTHKHRLQMIENHDQYKRMKILKDLSKSISQATENRNQYLNNKIKSKIHQYLKQELIKKRKRIKQKRNQYQRQISRKKIIKAVNKPRKIENRFQLDKSIKIEQRPKILKQSNSLYNLRNNYSEDKGQEISQESEEIQITNNIKQINQKFLLQIRNYLFQSKKTVKAFGEQDLLKFQEFLKDTNIQFQQKYFHHII